MPDRYEKLDYADRWINDGFRIIDTPGFFVSVEVDMSRAQALLDRLRDSGIKATYTHLVVRAVALTLARHPELHKLVAGNRRCFPERVDIALSVSGEAVYAPLMLLEGADRKNLQQVAHEVIERTPAIREKEQQTLAGLRKWGRILPLSWLRRSFLRIMNKSFMVRRSSNGTFQVTCIANVDTFVPFMFGTAAALGVGRVRDRVVAIDQQPTVRPTLTLSCCVDHKAWDGMAAATFLTHLQQLLESDALEAEARAGVEEAPAAVWEDQVPAGAWEVALVGA